MTGSGSADTLIAHGVVLPSAGEAEPIWDGFVAVKDGTVSALGAMSDLPADLRAADVLDARGGVVMPGLINTHTHLAMTVFRGLADDLPLMTWLQDHIFPAEAAHVNGELVYWGAKLACAEMLLSGTTGLADGYFYEDQAALAVEEAGLRAVLGQGVLDFPAPGSPDPTRNLDVAEEFIRRWRDASPRIQPSVFCHSPYTCSPETLTRGKDLARRTGTLFQIHVAETRDEVERIKAERGRSPVRYLDDLGILDESTLAVHGVHIDDADIDILAERRTPMAICVESNMKLASGAAPVSRLLERGVRVSLGTDGAASNNDLNMFGEMRSLALLHKVRGLDPTVLPAGRVLSLAVSGGADALGWSETVGRLAPGCRADLIVLQPDQAHFHPLYHPASHVVYAAAGGEVSAVLVDGRALVRDGRLLTLDLEEVLARTREIAARILGGE